VKTSNNIDKKYLSLFLLATSLLLSPALMNVSFSQGQDLSSNVGSSSPDTRQYFVVSDSNTFLLEDLTVPEQDYLHLYSSLPNKIVQGHITAKVPCNENNTTDIRISLDPPASAMEGGLNFIPHVSTAGELCLYEGFVSSNGSSYITDIAIFNNSTDDITFPPTSTIAIKTNELGSLPQAVADNNLTDIIESEPMPRDATSALSINNNLSNSSSSSSNINTTDAGSSPLATTVLNSSNNTNNNSNFDTVNP